MTNILPKVSVVFVTYDRFVTLEPTLESFLRNTDYPRDRLELIVADDASPASVQEAIKALPFDRFCFAEKRGGLGANVNQGLRAATGDLILQLQDDWECRGPPDYLKRATGIMSSDPDIGMLILNHHPNEIPILDRRVISGGEVTVYDYPPGDIACVGQNAYTDWPHLKRADFHRDIGLYKEGVPMWICELDFARRANRQRKHFIADQPGSNVFKHIGAEHSYNTGPLRTQVATALSRLPFGNGLLAVYRRLKGLVVAPAPTSKRRSDYVP